MIGETLRLAYTYKGSESIIDFATADTELVKAFAAALDNAPAFSGVRITRVERVEVGFR